MLELAILIRTIYFLKHNCHNLVSQASFFADHEFLVSSYAMSLDQYDGIIERMIGLNQLPNLVDIQVQAANKLTQIPISYRDNSECFYSILALNKIALSMIEKLVQSQGFSEGTKQMLGGFADQIEIEQYKINQRLKNRGNS